MVYKKKVAIYNEIATLYTLYYILLFISVPLKSGPVKY